MARLGRTLAVVILHITTRSAWTAAEAAGAYEAPSLATEGFIHLSEPHQVLRVADARFRGTTEGSCCCASIRSGSSRS